MLHRILEQLPDGTFRTGGDANAVPDSASVHARRDRGRRRPRRAVDRAALALAAQERDRRRWSPRVALLVMLRLAPRAFDPAFDPWASGRRVNPAEVLLGRSGGTPDARRAVGGRRLLPESLHDLVLDAARRAELAAQRRTVQLLEGLS